MVDIPGVTDAQKADLYRFLRDMPQPWDLYLFSLTHFPGCAYVEDRLARGELQESEVEGVATKTFRQYRVDLHYPRPPEDLYWISLMVLLSSRVLPPDVMDRVAGTGWLRRNPEALRALAVTANLVKAGRVGTEMLREGEMTSTLLARWGRLGRMITL
jgi:hypothetical protein